LIGLVGAVETLGGLKQAGGLLMDLVDAMFEKFITRTDVYSLQKPNGGYVKIVAPLTRKVIVDHINCKRTVGVYQLNRNNCVKWLCFDFDPEKLNDPAAAVRKILKTCLQKTPDADGTARPRIWPHSILLEASRYPDSSYHLWIFFTLPVPAKVARWLGLRICELGGISPKLLEIFPKQVELTECSPYGNLVKLPLGLHQVERKRSCFLDFETFKPVPDEVLLEKVGLSFSETDIQKIMKFNVERASIQASLTNNISCKPLTASEEEFCIAFLSKLWVPGYRNRVEMAFLGWCIKNGVSYESARRIIEEVARRKGDEEYAERLYLVDYHYRNRIRLGKRLKGISGLKEAVMEALAK
jgi:hypothetical protein